MATTGEPTLTVTPVSATTVSTAPPVVDWVKEKLPKSEPMPAPGPTTSASASAISSSTRR